MYALSAGSFGVIEEKGLNMFLRRLQEDQQDMLELIKDRERARKKGLHEQALPVLKVPAPAVVWDVGTPLSPLQSQGVDPSPQEGTLDQQAAAAPVATPSQGKLLFPLQCLCMCLVSRLDSN